MYWVTSTTTSLFGLPSLCPKKLQKKFCLKNLWCRHIAILAKHLLSVSQFSCKCCYMAVPELFLPDWIQILINYMFHRHHISTSCTFTNYSRAEWSTLKNNTGLAFAGFSINFFSNIFTVREDFTKLFNKLCQQRNQTGDFKHPSRFLKIHI